MTPDPDVQPLVKCTCDCLCNALNLADDGLCPDCRKGDCFYITGDAGKSA